MIVRILLWTAAMAVVALYLVDTSSGTGWSTDAKIERYCRYLVATERQVANCRTNITPDFLQRARNQASFYASGMDTRCLSRSGPLCRE